MNQKLQGILIRRRRQALGWSQTNLCAGICAVSHLSKIEQGKTESSSEVVELLLARLGISWRQDPVFIRETADWFEGWYERLFIGEDVSAMAPELEARREDLCSSYFFLDWLLFTWVILGKAPEAPEEFVPAMDDRQHNLYLCLTERFHELLRATDQSYFLLKAGIQLYCTGNYVDSVSCLQRGTERACQEGSLPVQLECRICLGNCYSALNQTQQIREHFSAALRMARSLGRQDDVQVISYNLAVAEMKNGQPEQALRRFLENPWEDGMYYHKLSLCYERLGRKEEALAALEQAEAAPLGELPGDPVAVREAFGQMCKVVRFRLEDPNYLKNQDYGTCLLSCIQRLGELFHMNFIRSHVPYLEEWYVANRQYQKAYDILRTIFLDSK